MSLLGHEGKLTLQREAPPTLLVKPVLLNDRLNCLNITNPNYWSGDKVVIFCEGGLPTHYNAGGTAAFGGKDNWFVGSSRSHITKGSDKFFRADGSLPFYEKNPANTPVQQTVYIHRDIMDRVSFYTTQQDALRGDLANRMQLARFNWGNLIIYPYGEGPYITAGIKLPASYDTGRYNSVSIGELSVDTENLLLQDWEFVADMGGWKFETDAAAIDTTPVGVKFGEAVKGNVTGSGSFDFIIRNSTTPLNSLSLLRLVLMTEKGCKATAQFWIYKDTESDCPTEIPGSLYYEAEILLTSSSIAVVASDLVKGSASFAVTGPIKLRLG